MSLDKHGFGGGFCVAVFSTGNVAWSMSAELEERIWFVIKHFCSDDEVFDGLVKARREAGLWP